MHTTHTLPVFEKSNVDVIILITVTVLDGVDSI